MNDLSGPLSPAGRIDLTRAPDFTLGEARIRPSACEVSVGGRPVRLQPRVMQVLVALARADGEVVSREALVESCWNGLSVGDDSLNRSIQSLRRLVEIEAAGAFTIETVSKVGYRLIRPPVIAPVADPAGSPVDGRGHVRSAAAGAVVAVLAVIAAIFVLGVRPARWSVERAERLVSTPVAERHPAISPDGTTLAYSAGPNIASRRIYLKRLSGGESIRLTDGPYDDAAPVWSPDGARIAYVADRPGEPCRIMVVNAPAGLAREVARCQGAERSRAAWSAAGDALLFSDALTSTGQGRIVRLDLATGRRQVLTHPPDGFADSEPTISPDGRWIAFDRGSPSTSDLMTIHNLRDGRERAVATFDEGNNFTFAWSEDSGSLFVASGKSRETSLWAYPIGGGARTLVAVLPLEVGRLASGPGGLLAAEINTSRFNVMRPPAPGDAAPIVIDPANGASWSPTFAADGTLALGSDRSDNIAIWLAEPGGAPRSFLSWGDGAIAGMSWSPDGAALAFVRLAGGRIALHVVSRAGRDLATIPVSATDIGDPVWRADGRSLLFPALDGHGWRLWRADLSRPDKPYPISNPGWIAVRTWGDILFGVKADQPGIWRLGPKPVQIVPGFSTRNSEGWTIFKDQIVFFDGDYPNPLRLLSAPISGGIARPFADTPRALHDESFAIDPRSGKPIYIGKVDSDTDIELFHLARR